jgi:DTW domain-containing protein YfiP
VVKLCVCGLVRDIVGDAPMLNTLRITILQDRKEALRRPFGSAIVCELALRNCVSVWYDTKVPEDIPLPEHLVGEKVGVLFPGPGARRLRRGAARDAGSDDGDSDVVFADRKNETADKPTHLIVIDTTWHRARRMYSRIPWIRDLPAYVLGDTTPLIHSGDDLVDDRDPQRPGDQNQNRNRNHTVSRSDDSSDSPSARTAVRTESGYRIRKQPMPGFLSTAECIAAALREGEPDDDDDDDDADADWNNGKKKSVSSGALRGAAAAEALERCFDAMIDAQVRSFSDRKSVRYRSRKRERAAKEAETAAKAKAAETVPGPTRTTG